MNDFEYCLSLKDEKRSNYSVGQMIMKNKSLLFASSVLLVASILVITFDTPVPKFSGYTLLGMAFGTFLNNITWFRRIVNNRQYNFALINWDKVDAIIKENTKSAPSGSNNLSKR